MTKPTFVTVGAGQTAAVAARTLRRKGFDGRIVLIGDEPHAPYQRPPLSKEFLAGDDDFDSLRLLPDSWLAKNDIEIVTGTVVTHVDAATCSVETAGGESFRADAVLFATGGRPRTLSVPGPRPDLVHYLRTVDDARRLRQSLQPGRRVALVGAGFIGLEIAASASTLGAEVTVFEAGAAPLGTILGADIGGLCAQIHRDNGVAIRTNAVVSSLRTTSDAVIVEQGDVSPQQFDSVVIGIGITPLVHAAVASGLAVANGIVTDSQGRTSISNVYAAGDVAQRFSPRVGRRVRFEHFDNANKQGAAVANTMLGRHAVSDEANWFWSDQYDHNLQFTGTVSGHDQTVVRGDVDARDFTVFYLDGRTVCGAFAIDRGEDIGAARQLLGRTVDPAVLADADTDLVELVETIHEVA